MPDDTSIGIFGIDNRFVNSLSNVGDGPRQKTFCVSHDKSLSIQKVKGKGYQDGDTSPDETPYPRLGFQDGNIDSIGRNQLPQSIEVGLNPSSIFFC
jgi:hypothetical protein